jgi:glyoxylase-like metal-dependent hydrolase (beta-lactamase superfamily II)
MSTGTRTIALTVMTLWLVGCSAPSQRQLAQDAVTAMGGADKLMAIQTLTMTDGTGTRTKVGQPSSATSPDVVGVLAKNVETLDLVNKRAAYDYDITVGTFMMHRHEVLNREKPDSKPFGVESIDGVTFATTPSGLFSWGTQNSPEWLLKRNPVSIALSAADSAPAGDAAEQEEFDGKMMNHGHGKSPDGEELEIYYDPDTKLIAGYQVLETETMLGDVDAVYFFSDYKDVNGVKLPHHIKILKGGEPYSEVQYASILVNDPKAAEVFAVQSSLAEQIGPATTGPDSFPMVLKKATNGVYQAQGFRHHSMVVEFPTFVAVVEAPYLDTQTRMLAKAIAAQFPDKPIKYVAVTHPHYDHVGGVRAAAALGATILVAKGQEPLMKKILDAKHTHPKDDLQTAIDAKKTVGMIETFEGKHVIKEGNQSLELHAYKSAHLDPMVMAYVPNGRVLFQSDIWIPGIGATANPAVVELNDAIKAANLKVDTMVGGHGLIGPYSEMTKALAAMK